MISTEFDKKFQELREAAFDLETYYTIDKVKPWSVYVWTKGDDGENVFDIEPDKLTYYVKSHEVIKEAVPLIQRVQQKLRELRGK